MQVDKARLDDGQSFEWKGKTYYRGPLVEYGTFGSSRKISLTPFPSVCPTCGDRSLRSTEGKEGEPVAWRCFYCDEVFQDEASATQHFGPRTCTVERVPACSVDIGYVRELEAQYEDAMNRVTASAWVNASAEDRAKLEAAAARLFQNYRPSDATGIRHVIDSFELWKCGDDTDGYQTSANHLAQIMARHTPSTKYYFDENGKTTQVEWAIEAPIKDTRSIMLEKALESAVSIIRREVSDGWVERNETDWTVVAAALTRSPE